MRSTCAAIAGNANGGGANGKPSGAGIRAADASGRCGSSSDKPGDGPLAAAPLTAAHLEVVDAFGADVIRVNERLANHGAFKRANFSSATQLAVVRAQHPIRRLRAVGIQRTATCAEAWEQPSWSLAGAHG